MSALLLRLDLACFHLIPEVHPSGSFKIKVIIENHIISPIMKSTPLFIWSCIWYMCEKISPQSLKELRDVFFF